jgi:hypothetical protein
MRKCPLRLARLPSFRGGTDEHFNFDTRKQTHKEKEPVWETLLERTAGSINIGCSLKETELIIVGKKSCAYDLMLVLPKRMPKPIV